MGAKGAKTSPNLLARPLKPAGNFLFFDYNIRSANFSVGKRSPPRALIVPGGGARGVPP